MIKKGFTLIELLVVIMILGVLAGLISGNFFSSLKKGRDAKRKADLSAIQRSLELYYEDNKAYPINITFNGQLCHPDGCATKIYMEKIPNDPVSGKNYQYLSPSGNGSDYKLFSCLENNLQILPYASTGYSFDSSSCGNCRNPTDTADVLCVWGVSSTNISP